MQFSSFRTFGIGKLMLFTCYLSSIELMSQANWIFILSKRAWKETCFVYTISFKNGNSALLRLLIWLNQCGLHSIIDIHLFPAPWKIYRRISLTHMLERCVCVEIVIDSEIIINCNNLVYEHQSLTMLLYITKALKHEVSLFSSQSREGFMYVAN